MTGAELVAYYLAWRVLSDLMGGKKAPPTRPGSPAPAERPPIIPPPPPPASTTPGSGKKPEPKPLPAKPEQVQWPQAGVPGAHATVTPGANLPPTPPPPPPVDEKAPSAGVPGATATVSNKPPPTVRNPPPPPTVDPKMPTAQKGMGGVTSAAQKGIDAMRKKQAAEQDMSGKGSRQYKPKRRGLTQTEISRAKQLLQDPDFKPGKRVRSNDDPSTIYVYAMHGKKRAVEVWTSNPDLW